MWRDPRLFSLLLSVRPETGRGALQSSFVGRSVSTGSTRTGKRKKGATRAGFFLLPSFLCSELRRRALQSSFVARSVSTGSTRTARKQGRDSRRFFLPFLPSLSPFALSLVEGLFRAAPTQERSSEQNQHRSAQPLQARREQRRHIDLIRRVRNRVSRYNLLRASGAQ
jgi:hypothetical protein